MPVYVDNMFMQATVGRITSKWCHLTADTLDELHALAAAIGLRRSWFQPSARWPDNEINRAKGRVGEQKGRDHYDVTLAKRKLAVERGAIEVSWGNEPWRAKKRRCNDGSQELEEPQCRRDQPGVDTPQE